MATYLVTLENWCYCNERDALYSVKTQDSVQNSQRASIFALLALIFETA